MERFLKQYEKEYMKMAMLKHEETFQQQVHELHRLYRVQKILMKDMKNTELKRQRRSAISRTDMGKWNAEDETGIRHNYQDHSRLRRTLDLELPAEEYIGSDDPGVTEEIEQESDLELTLATGSSRRKKGETSFTSDSGASFSSSSTESGRFKLQPHEWGLFQMPDINMSSQSERMSSFDVEEQMRQDRLKQPPWLFHCLSLNMT